MTDNYFAELAKVDCSTHVETKGQFSYLSWAWAVDALCKRFPGAKWEVKRFPLNASENAPLVPYLHSPLGYFVEVEVTVEGVSRSQIHPVLDNRNRPIEKPSSFDINTSIQRALVKAIGLHGLGLYIYAGEDLPDLGVEKKELDTFSKAVKAGNEKAALWLLNLHANDQDRYLALHSAYMATVKEGKVKERQKIDTLIKQAQDSLDGLLTEFQERIDSGEDIGPELAEEPPYVQEFVKSRLTPEQQQKIAA